MKEKIYGKYTSWHPFQSRLPIGLNGCTIAFRIFCIYISLILTQPAMAMFLRSASSRSKILQNQSQTKANRSFRSILILLFLPVALWSQTKERTIEKSYDLQPGSTASFELKEGNILVQKSQDNKLHINLRVKVTGKFEEDIEDLLEAIELDVTDNSSNFRAECKTNIVMWSQTFGKSKLRLKSGAVLEGIKDLDLDMTVKLPNVKSLNLANRFGKIEIEEDLESDLDVKIYEGDLQTQDLGGDLKIESKFSDLEVGHFENGNLDLYESHFKGGEGENLEIKSKFSQIQLDQSSGLILDSYEGDHYIRRVTGDATISDKFSSLEIDYLTNAKLNFYETECEIETAKKIEADTKYGSMEASKIEHLVLTKSYEFNVELDSVRRFIAHDDKYGNIEIHALEEVFKITGYESDVEVKKVSRTLTELRIESKYDKMYFGLPSDLNFDLDAELKYGNIQFHEGSTQNINRTEKGDQITVKSSSPNAKATIFVRAYETDINLRY